MPSWSVVAEHKEMLEALTARDAEALAEVLIRHLERTSERVQDALEAPSRLRDGASLSGES
ncbi:MAG: FCD domain-containing protein [Acetobacteraceae bacterium]